MLKETGTGHLILGTEVTYSVSCQVNAGNQARTDPPLQLYAQLFTWVLGIVAQVLTLGWESSGQLGRPFPLLHIIVLD